MSTKRTKKPSQRALIECYAEYSGHHLLFADGFDEAIIGLSEPYFGRAPAVAYDKAKMVEVLMKRDKMGRYEAIEFLEFNTWNAYVGEHTPVWIDTKDLTAYAEPEAPAVCQKPAKAPAKGKTRPTKQSGS